MRELISKKSLHQGTTYKKNESKNSFLKSSAFSKSNNKDPYCVKSKEMVQNKCRDTCPKCHKELRFYRKFIFKEQTVKILKKFDIKPSYVIISPFEKMVCKKEETQLTAKVCQIKEVERAKRQQEFLERYFLKYGVKHSDISAYCVQEKLTVDALIFGVYNQFNELQEYGVNPDNIAKIYFQREKNISRFITSLQQFKSVCSELEKKRLKYFSEKSKKIDTPELKNLIIRLQRLENINLPSSLKISLPVSKNDRTYPILRDLRNKIKQKTKSSKSFEDDKILQENKEMEVEDNSMYATQLSETLKQNYQAFSERDDEFQNKSNWKCIVRVQRLKDDTIRSYLGDLSISDKEESSVVKNKSQEKAESLTEPDKMLRKRRKTDDKKNEDNHTFGRMSTRSMKKKKNEIYDESTCTNVKSVFQIAKVLSTVTKGILEQSRDVYESESFSQSHMEIDKDEKVAEIQTEKGKSKDNTQIQESDLLVNKDTSKRTRTLSMEKHEKEIFEDVNTSENADSEVFQLPKGTSTVSEGILEQKKYLTESEPLNQSQKEVDKDEKGVEIQKAKSKDNAEIQESDSLVNKDTRKRMRTRSMEKQDKEVFKDGNASDNAELEVVFQISKGTATISEGTLEQEKDIFESEPLSQSPKEMDKDEKLLNEKVTEIHDNKGKTRNNTQIQKNVSLVNKYSCKRMRTRSMEKQGTEILEGENAEVFEIAKGTSAINEGILEQKTNISVSGPSSKSQKEKDEKFTSEKVVEIHEDKGKAREARIRKSVSVVNKYTRRRMSTRSREKLGKDILKDENAASEVILIAKGASAVREGMLEQKKDDVSELFSQDQVEMDKHVKLTHEKVVGIQKEKAKRKDNNKKKRSVSQVNKDIGRRMNTRSMEELGREISENVNANERIAEQKRGTLSHKPESIIHKTRIANINCKISDNTPKMNEDKLQKEVDTHVCKPFMIEEMNTEMEGVHHVKSTEKSKNRDEELTNEKAVENLKKYEEKSKPRDNLQVKENGSLVIIDDCKNDSKELSSEIIIDMDVEESEKGKNEDVSMIECKNYIKSQTVNAIFENSDKSQSNLIDMKDIERKESYDNEDLCDTEVESVDFQMSASMEDSSTLNESEGIQETCAVTENEAGDRTLGKSQSKEGITDVVVCSEKLLLEMKSLSVDDSLALNESGEIQEAYATNEYELDERRLEKSQSKKEIAAVVEDSEKSLLEVKSSSVDDSSALNESEGIQETCAVTENEAGDRTLGKSQSKEGITGLVVYSEKLLLEMKSLSVDDSLALNESGEIQEAYATNEYELDERRLEKSQSKEEITAVVEDSEKSLLEVKSSSVDDSSALNESEEIQETCDERRLEKSQSTKEITVAIGDRENPFLKPKADVKPAKSSYDANLQINNSYCLLYYYMLYAKNRLNSAIEEVLNRETQPSPLTFIGNSTQKPDSTSSHEDNFLATLLEQTRC